MGEKAQVVGAERVLVLLRALAEHGQGATLDELAAVVDGSKPTIHRGLALLCRIGFARRDERGRYSLGDQFLRLAFTYHEQQTDHLRAQPILTALAQRFGETAHYAVLDGRDVVYRGKVDPPDRAVRLTSVIGGRNPAHCTAVGKALLAHRLTGEAQVRAWLADGDLDARTDSTIVAPAAFATELARVSEQGYAVEDEENELGIACLAVPVWWGPGTEPTGAISISAVRYRTPLAALLDRLPEIRAIIDGAP
ncbi:IclR family transcriptional regulator [Occultella kanbiaonis]|uniref:IclR family transcriptional regulator n=1 Tax=Occultella kanbiaonis TaxID=2675754 RepID=UPI0012BA27EB|nr:IclR family transcriptional regulator [Occultella kanbiaonis]